MSGCVYYFVFCENISSYLYSVVLLQLKSKELFECAVYDMEEFSVFKSRETKKIVDCHSIFVPHVPLFDESNKKSISDLIALNERFYDVDSKRPILASCKQTRINASVLDISLSSGGSNGAKLQKNYEQQSTLIFKRKRIKDIDLRFSETGLMSYCDYLRGRGGSIN